MTASTSTDDDRPFDVLVYGATGYTGKRVAMHAIEQHPTLNVGISGRSESKLKAVAEELGLPPSSVLVAPLVDDGDGSGDGGGNNVPRELVDALRASRVVLACAGPYRRCGLPLVRAAVEAGTHYLDLCGEPQFFDDVLVECEESARSANVLVVSACAFDCVPAELSASLVSREVRRRFASDGGESGGQEGEAAAGAGAVVSGVEVCHTFGGIARANATTFHAAVDGFHAASTGELRKSRRRVTDTFDPPTPPPRPNGWPSLPPAAGNLPTVHTPSGTHALRFPGADAAAILATWRYLRLRRPDRHGSVPQPLLSVSFGCPDRMAAAKVLGAGAVFSSLARFRWGCDLLHSYPTFFSNGVFTEGGPTQQELDGGSFCTHSAAYGRTEDEVVRATCRGPEPGYVATPRMIVALAVTVLRHGDRLPFRGGVMPPGALFGECDEAYELLRESGIVFEIADEEAADGAGGAGA